MYNKPGKSPEKKMSKSAKAKEKAEKKEYKKLMKKNISPRKQGLKRTKVKFDDGTKMNIWSAKK